VRLVYIDEAGISNPAQEPFLVVAGHIVHADHTLNGVENQLERIVERYIPVEYRQEYVLSAKHLFNGGDKVFDRRKWPLESRLKIADEIMGMPRKFSLPIALGFVERASFPRTFELPEGMPEKEKTIAAHVSAFMTCAMVVEHWMRERTKNENCLLIVENNDQAKKMMADVQRHHQNRWLAVDEKESRHFPLRKIREDPLFQPKRPTSALILADFITKKF
jgi:hypothetical protein